MWSLQLYIDITPYYYVLKWSSTNDPKLDYGCYVLIKVNFLINFMYCDTEFKI